MPLWRRFVQIVGAAFIGIGAGAAYLSGVAGLPAASAIDLILLVGPGIAVVYAGLQMAGPGIDRDLEPRIVAVTLAGIALMVTVIGLMMVNPAGELTRPVRAVLYGAAIGAGGGVAIGLNHARAMTEERRAARMSERAAQIQKRNRQLDEFASVVSHDLRNPLTAIYGALDLLADERDDDRIDDALEAADRMRELIDDLLRLARQGRIVDDAEPVRLDEVARKAWSVVEADGTALDLSDADVTIGADPSRLREMLENLFSNACEQGAGNVRVGATDGRDAFYVEDDGPGIPADEREDVLSAGYTTGEEGRGFGLSIVHRIAEAHGWEIDIQESRQGGARFVFTVRRSGGATDAGRGG